MARAPAAFPTAPLPPSSVVPRPPANLASLGKLMSWKAHVLIHRIHPDVYGATQFNPSASGNARFSPIQSAPGVPIPTLYGSMAFEGAAMETVFHDVPLTTGLKTYQKSKLDGHSYSILDPQTDLTLLDLRGLGLRKLGLQQKDLIETEKDTYPQTRSWAEACHAAFPAAQGMVWVSRQHNTTQAVVLFEDRISLGTLVVNQAPQSITMPPSGHYTSLLELAQSIDVKIA